MSAKKPLCEVIGDADKHQEETTVKVDLPTTKPVSVNVTIKQQDKEKKEETQKGRQLLNG